MNHYLIGMDLQMNGRPTRVHAYVMTTEPQHLMLVTNKMMSYVEEHYGPPLLPIVLQTKLDAKTAEEIRTELRQRIPETSRSLDNAIDFHVSMWEMAIADPWDEKLWGLH